MLCPVDESIISDSSVVTKEVAAWVQAKMSNTNAMLDEFDPFVKPLPERYYSKFMCLNSQYLKSLEKRNALNWEYNSVNFTIVAKKSIRRRENDLEVN